MKLLLIDTPRRRITEIKVEKLDLDQIYSLIGCSTFEGHHIPSVPGHWLYCDGEGRFKPGLPFFLLEGFPEAIFGRALVFRHDGSGDEASATISDLDLAFRVEFP